MTIPNDLKIYFKALALLGVAVGIVDTWLSTKFGWSTSIDLAIGYGAISLASGLLLVIAYFFHRQGFKSLASGLAVAWIFAFTFNVYSNMGVATANRMADVQQAGVKQVKWDSKKAATEEAKAKLSIFTEQLKTLTEKEGWAAATTADALREELKTLRDRMSAEEKGKRGRKAGKGSEFERLQDQANALVAKIATVEQRTSLESQIAATKKVLSDARAELDTADKGISHTANQATLHAKFIRFVSGNGFSGDPTSEEVMTANEGTGIAAALVIALMSAALTLAGAWPALQGVGPVSKEGYTAQSPTPTHSNVPSHPHTREIIRESKPSIHNLTVMRATIEDMMRAREVTA